jgi:uncharacterized protein YeaO (DUF488 family)
MLRRASVSDVENERVSREKSYLVVVMRFYPRFLKRDLVDEYVRMLAPPAELFADFKTKDRKLANHNSAFYLVEYEERFDLTPEGREKLAELSELSRERDIVLICQCRDFDRCHCDLLLNWAKRCFNAEVSGLIFDYPDFLKRLESKEFCTPLQNSTSERVEKVSKPRRSLDYK